MTAEPKPNPIPSRYRRVTPALVVEGAAKALEFYAEVFGATERMRFPGPGGTIAHAEIEIGDSVVIVEDASPYMGTTAPPPGGLEGSPTFLFVYVEDVDATIDAGGRARRDAEAPGAGPVLRRPRRLHRRPVRARLDGRVPRRGRRAGRDDAPDDAMAAMHGEG